MFVWRIKKGLIKTKELCTAVRLDMLFPKKLRYRMSLSREILFARLEKRIL
jgi:hypothetical protein